MTKPHERADTSLDLAVIGAGAAGLTAAYLLARRHRVTLYERSTRLGGHAHTFRVPDGADAGTPLDVAFMVLNDRTYPTMHRLLAELGIGDIAPSEMSFGYCSADTTTQYALNFSPAGPFAAPAADTAAGPSLSQRVLGAHIGEILRFMRRAARDERQGTLGDTPLGDYLHLQGASPWLVDSYVVPMGAAIWSMDPARMLSFPAATFLRFYANHGLLALEGGPSWQHLHGGSVRYVEAIERRFQGTIVRGADIERVERTRGGAVVHLAQGAPQRFDGVVFATPAHRTLALLADPSPDEQRLLGAWRYQRHAAVLHCDAAQMPPDRSAWASWNYRQHTTDLGAASVSITYHLNRLQGHTATARQYFLTLDGVQPVAPHSVQPVAEAEVLARFELEHPIYDAAAVSSQPALRALNGTRATWFCGNYLGYGFHEDAIASGAEVAAHLGAPL